eukprot:1030665_1
MFQWCVLCIQTSKIYSASTKCHHTIHCWYYAHGWICVQYDGDVIDGFGTISSIDISSTFSSVFDKPWLEGIFSLSAMCIILYFQLMDTAVAPAIIQQLSTDGLWFKVFGTLDDDNAPMRALLLFGILCIACAAVLDMRVLIELAAIMNLVNHLLICGSILIMRYSHAIHEKYHSQLKERETQQSFQTKRKLMYQGHETQVNGHQIDEDIKEDENMDAIDHQIHDLNVKMEKSKEWSHASIVGLVWMYSVFSIMICILLFYYDQMRGIHINIWTFVTVFLCVVVVYLSGVFVYLHQRLQWRSWISPLENNKNEVFVSPWCPYLPLCGIILNSAM